MKCRKGKPYGRFDIHGRQNGKIPTRRAGARVRVARACQHAAGGTVHRPVHSEHSGYSSSPGETAGPSHDPELVSVFGAPHAVSSGLWRHTVVQRFAQAVQFLRRPLQRVGQLRESGRDPVSQRQLRRGSRRTVAVPGQTRRAGLHHIDRQLQHHAAGRAPERSAGVPFGLPGPHRGREPDREAFLAPRPRSDPLSGQGLSGHPRRRRRLHERKMQPRGRRSGLPRLAPRAAGGFRRGDPALHGLPAVWRFPLLPAGARDEQSRNGFPGRGCDFHPAGGSAGPDRTLPLLRLEHDRHGRLETRDRRLPLPGPHLRRDAQRKLLRARGLRFLDVRPQRHVAHVHRAFAYRHRQGFRSGAGDKFRLGRGPRRSRPAAGLPAGSGCSVLRLRFGGHAHHGHTCLGRGPARLPLPGAHLRRDAQRKLLHARGLRFLDDQPQRREPHVHRAQPDDQLHAPGAGVQRFGRRFPARGRDTYVQQPLRRGGYMRLGARAPLADG